MNQPTGHLESCQLLKNHPGPCDCGVQFAKDKERFDKRFAENQAEIARLRAEVTRLTEAEAEAGARASRLWQEASSEVAELREAIQQYDNDPHISAHKMISKIRDILAKTQPKE